MHTLCFHLDGVTMATCICGSRPCGVEGIRLQARGRKSTGVQDRSAKEERQDNGESDEEIYKDGVEM